jgi:hypothetical protein
MLYPTTGPGVEHDRDREVLLEALRQALAGDAGPRDGEQRLYRAGKLAGLFRGRAGSNARAAAQALRDGLLEVVRTEVRGKSAVEWVRLTPRGVDFLHEHESPVRALQELRSALRSNRQAVPAWLEEMGNGLRGLEERLRADARTWLRRLEALERRVEEALRRLEAAAPLLPPDVAEAHPWALDALNYLDRRRSGGAPGGCPLPELFAAVVRQHPGLSVSAFHEGLRRLHERRALHLEPDASPAGLPQPEFALLERGAVLYHASR